MKRKKNKHVLIERYIGNGTGKDMSVVCEPTKPLT